MSPALPALWLRPEKGKVSMLSFANIFSCSVTYLILSTLCFTEQKGVFFSFFLIKKNLSILSCIVPLVLYLKRHHRTQEYLDFSPMLSSRSFIVLHFTFRSLTTFVLIFAESVRSVSGFSFLHTDVQLFYHHWLKTAAFLKISCVA